MIFFNKLSNGIRVVVNEMPGYRSCAVGIWLRTGSADEEENNNGISHFIEHMCFKGTEKRSALAIASDMDSVGAQINAFTSKECTCYHAKVMSEKVETAIDVLCDLVTNSLFDEKEIEKEKSVVLEEINMNNDTPDDLAHETISEIYFGNSPLAKPILGLPKSVKSLKREDLIEYTNNNYSPDRMVLSVAGGVKTDEITELLEKYMGSYRPDSNTQSKDIEQYDHALEKQFKAISKDTEQIQICLGMRGFSFINPKRYAMSIINNAFGGTMSSRLFQKIREQRGLAYSVYSYSSTYTRAGMFTVYAGTSSNYAEEVLTLLLAELKELKQNGITKEEYIKSREQLKGGYILSMESTSAKMNQNGKNMVLRNKVVAEEEEIKRFMSATYDDCMEVCRELFDLETISAAFVGKIGDEKKLHSLIYN